MVVLVLVVILVKAIETVFGYRELHEKISRISDLFSWQARIVGSLGMYYGLNRIRLARKQTFGNKSSIFLFDKEYGVLYYFFSFLLFRYLEWYRIKS